MAGLMNQSGFTLTHARERWMNKFSKKWYTKISPKIDVAKGKNTNGTTLMEEGILARMLGCIKLLLDENK